MRTVEAIARREVCGDEGRQLCSAAPTERWHALPDRVKQRATDLRMRRLWGSPDDDPNASQRNLLVITAGIRQKDWVDKMVSRFDLVRVRVCV